MAYQKLQVSSSLDIIPSDTVDIPNPSSEVQIVQREVIVTSTANAPVGELDQLSDATVNFLATGATPLGIQVGDIVINTVSRATATVVTVDSATLLTLSAAIMPESPAAAEAYIITRSDDKMREDLGEGVQDASSDLTLSEAGQNFVSTVAIGDIVVNLATGQSAAVVTVDSNTQLTLSYSIMPVPAGPAQEYEILEAAPIADVSVGAFDVAGTLTLGAGALASEAGILPGAIVYNTGAAKAYTVVEVVDDVTITITPLSAGGATDAFVIYNEATDAAVLYSGGSLQDIKTTMASNSVDVFKNIPQGAYLPIQVKRVWDNSDTPQDVIALW